MSALQQAVNKAYAEHLAAMRAADLPANIKADKIAETRIALQEAEHKLRRARRAAQH